MAKFILSFETKAMCEKEIIAKDRSEAEEKAMEMQNKLSFEDFVIDEAYIEWTETSEIKPKN